MFDGISNIPVGQVDDPSTISKVLEVSVQPYSGTGTDIDREFFLKPNTTASSTFGYNASGSIIWEKDANDALLVEYDWDAEENLIKVSRYERDEYDEVVFTSEIDYDHMNRWVRIKEYSHSTLFTQSPSYLRQTRHFVWSGYSLVRQVVVNGVQYTATHKLIDYFDEGEIHRSGVTECPDTSENPDCVNSGIPGIGILTEKYLYVRDHLGSVVQMIKLNNALGGSVVREFDYDPWGVQEEVYTAADFAPEASIGFTGHYEHGWSGLTLAPLRAYRADLGRWIKRDPIKEAGGINLYAYAGNNPVNFTDPLGLLYSGGFWQSLFVNLGLGGLDCFGSGAYDGYLGYSTGVFSALGANDYSDQDNMGQQWGHAFGDATFEVEKFIAESVIGGKILGAAAKGIGTGLGKISNLLKRCNSFEAGTLIQTPTGLVAIEDIVIWDTVYAWNEETQTVEERIVTQLIENDAVEIYEITFQTGERVRTTAEHPFWIVEQQAWIDASALEAGYVGAFA